MLETHSLNQSERILRYLKIAGERGVKNWMFMKMGIMQYNARIKELRDDGYKIKATRVYKNGRATGTFTYTLEEV